jgi:large subunit ribosomal protein L17
MRHLKHRNQLGVKKEHRAALMANLASSLIKAGRIRTTLKKAKALRPFVEPLVTLAKKGDLHHRRIAISRLRDEEAVRILFSTRVSEFAKRNGGYTRIYKLGDRRIGDAAEMALIEFVGADDAGYRKSRRRGSKAAKKPAAEDSTPVEVAAVTEEAAPETAEAAPEKKDDKAEA